jgi:DnaK suppressor protein
VTTASPLSPLERLHLREQLQDLWRDQLEIVVAVDYRVGTRRADAAGVEPEKLARARATARSVLVEVEAAMHRMDWRRYGVCEKCAQPIPIVDLLMTPHRRHCAGCDGFATVTGERQERNAVAGH